MEYLDAGREIAMPKTFKICMTICAVGFVTGILYANLIAQDSIRQIGVFTENHLSQYVREHITESEYLWYIVRRRGVLLGLLFLAGGTRWKKMGAIIFLIWMSFLMGILLCSAVLQMGGKGIVICVAGLLPHTLFYLCSYVILLIYLLEYPRIRLSWQKTVRVLALFIAGILLEYSVAPGLLKYMISWCI